MRDTTRTATPAPSAGHNRAGFASAAPAGPHADVTAVVNLGRLVLAFGRVNRMTFHEDGVTPESDTDHTVMLGAVACAFAARHLPHLNLGLVAQYALVHDLVEVYAGDTPTLRINPAQLADKHQREQAALARITREFTALPWLADTITQYENRQVAEARYVKAMDKLLPKITHIANGGQTLHNHGITHTELTARYTQQLGELQAYAGDFPALFDLRTELLAWLYDTVQPEALGG